MRLHRLASVRRTLFTLYALKCTRGPFLLLIEGEVEGVFRVTFVCAPIPCDATAARVGPNNDVTSFPSCHPVLIFCSVVRSIFPLLGFYDASTRSSGRVTSRGFSR